MKPERIEEITLTVSRSVTVRRSTGPKGGPPPDHVLRSRHTKNARGMTITAHRSGHKMSDDASRLSVRGTTAAITTSLSYKTKRLPCACCGSITGKWTLNDSGRSRLRHLRWLRAQRTQQ